MQIINQIYSIPESVAQGSGQKVLTARADVRGREGPGWSPLSDLPHLQLFDHIVDCIVDFQEKQGLRGQSLPLGFTFSFPCKQLGLDQVREGRPEKATPLRGSHPHILHGQGITLTHGGGGALLGWACQSP